MVLCRYRGNLEYWSPCLDIMQYVRTSEKRCIIVVNLATKVNKSDTHDEFGDIENSGIQCGLNSL